MTAPEVSVILPLHQGERFLGEAMDSVLTQDGPALELIVVDDRSTDGGPTIARVRAAADARVRVIAAAPGTGVAAARNAGIASAAAPVIGFIDQDDRWTNAKLSRQIALMQTEEAEAVVGHLRQFLSPGEPLPGWARKEAIGAEVPGWEPGTLIATRALLDRFGGFDPSFQKGGDDSDLFFRLRDAGVVVPICATLCLEKRIHGGNASGDPAHMMDLMKTLRASVARKRAKGGGT